MEFKRIIDGSNDPIFAWNRLKLNHWPKSCSHHMRIFTDLIECKLGANEFISLFSTRVMRIYNDIKNINANFVEGYANFQVLRYLPRRFDEVVQSILKWKKTDFTLSKVVDELSVEESDLKV